MGNGMKTRRLRCQRLQSLDRRADRAVITVVLLAVTIVLLLIGFAGPSIYFTLPGPMGWLYLAVVVVAAAFTLVWLYCVEDKRKKGNPSRLRSANPRSKRSSLR